MNSTDLYNKLNSFFDLDSAEYRFLQNRLDAEGHYPQYIEIAAKQALKKIGTFSTENDHIIIDSTSINSLKECISALVTCKSTGSSISREKTIVSVYNFLQHFRWKDNAPPYIGYHKWGPIIYHLSESQLAYYLWWREEAKAGRIHVATREYVWLYVYDIVLNTCFSSVTDSLAALEKLYAEYPQSEPVMTNKILTHKALSNYISSYVLYNNLSDSIERVLDTYGFDDLFYMYSRIAKGDFSHLEQELLSLGTSQVQTKVFNSSNEKKIVLAIISGIFERIYQLCRTNSINIVDDFCGVFNDHARWTPYNSPVLHAKAVMCSTVERERVSFLLNDNEYVYADGVDLASEERLANAAYWIYDEDDGKNFHRQGCYYRKEYTGPNLVASTLVDYVVRQIQIYYRDLCGGRTLKPMVCPYATIKSEIDTYILECVRQYISNEYSTTTTSSRKKHQYSVIPENMVNIPARYRYVCCMGIEESVGNTPDVKKGKFMAEVKTVDILRENFEKLKDQYSPNKSDSTVLETLAHKIVVPMLELDLDNGCMMWEYLLQRYYRKCHDVVYSTLTDDVVRNSSTKILAQVFRKNEAIKKYVFLLDPYPNHLHCEWFIQDLLLSEDYALADELISLYSQNNAGDNNSTENLYSVLYQTINSDESRWKITSEGIDFLNRWISKIQSPNKRAELEVALLSLIDCVEGSASKGSMPFNLFMQEGGLQMLMEDRIKSQAKKTSQEQHSTFEDFMNARKKPDNTSASSIDTHHAATGAMQSSAKDCSQTTNKEELLERSLEELNSLIGLQAVKQEISSLANLMRIRRIREELGLKMPDTSQHLVFSGNPGTGKTTVARIVGKIYHSLGFLSKGHLIEVDRSGLVAGYVGQTAIKTQEVIQRALGGVLFIDEAYSLAPERSENDFGQEAIDTLLKAMEDNRGDLVVIVAGYDNLMPRFIESNPGLKSRFNKYILFPDYTGDELYSIFEALLQKNDYLMEELAKSMMMDHLDSLYKKRDENFGNARDVRNLFERLISHQANRLIGEAHLSVEAVQLIKAEDIMKTLSTI